MFAASAGTWNWHQLHQYDIVVFHWPAARPLSWQAGRTGSAALRGDVPRGRIADSLGRAEAEFHTLLQRNRFDGSVMHIGDPADYRQA